MPGRHPIIQCQRSADVERQIQDYATALTDEAFAIGNHGFATEREFWESGLFKSAVERLRGQQSATQKEKQGFIKMVLAHLKARRVRRCN